MRVILTGSEAARTQLRSALTEAGIEIAAEFDSISQARASSIDAEAIVVATRNRSLRDIAGDEWIAQPLTPREIEVLDLVAEGLPNKSIAERLGISAQTVKFHVASIASKLGAANRTEIVRLALRRGLISV
jgi:DNA-binding NarL/FixJ family response regulator